MIRKNKYLLITKNYPPQIGGIEKYAFDLYRKLIQEGNIVKLVIAGPRNEDLLVKKSAPGIINIFWKFCYFFSELYRLFLFTLKSLTFGFFYAYKSDFIWAMDGSISGLAVIIGSLTGGKTRVTIHGTDIVWDNPIYQCIIPQIINLCDEIYVISHHTQQECLKRCIKSSKIIFKPHVHDSISYVDSGIFDKSDFLKNIGIANPLDKIILFSIGRWVERKGFHWFLNEILPDLDPNLFHYILAGFGPYEWRYRSIIDKRKIKNITLIGLVDDLAKAKLFLSSDLFIVPNILVPGDTEGFGLVLLEAQHYNCKVLVTDVDSFRHLLGQDSGSAITVCSQSDFLTKIKLLSQDQKKSYTSFN